MRMHKIRTGLIMGLISLSSCVAVQAAEPVTRVTVFAGPETVLPLANIYIDVEVLGRNGASDMNGQRVTLHEASKDTETMWEALTLNGLASFIIPAGQVSGDRIFYASVNGDVSKRVSVFITSGRVDRLKARLGFVEVSNSLRVDIGPLYDAFGNMLEDGTLVSISTRTPSGEMTIDSLPLIRGHTHWVLLCDRYRTGIDSITVSVKTAQKQIKNDRHICLKTASSSMGGAS